jgi:hypothetical protein
MRLLAAALRWVGALFSAAPDRPAKPAEDLLLDARDRFSRYY